MCVVLIRVPYIHSVINVKDLIGHVDMFIGHVNVGMRSFFPMNLVFICRELMAVHGFGGDDTKGMQHAVYRKLTVGVAAAS